MASQRTELQEEMLNKLKYYTLHRLRSRDINRVEHYNIFVQVIETKCLLKLLCEIDIISLEPTINYLVEKLQYMEREIEKFQEETMQ